MGVLRFRTLDRWAALRFRGVELGFQEVEMSAGEPSSGFSAWGAARIAARLVGIILAAAAIVP